MMWTRLRAVVAIAVVACAASHTSEDAASPPGEDASPATCSGHYALPITGIDRTCATDGDCAIGAHWTTCCRDVWAMGIARSARDSFDAAESACRVGLDACGCPAFMLSADDGGRYMEGGAPVAATVVACIGGQCTTRLRPSVGCGSTACRPSEACVTGCADDGGVPATGCVRIPSECAASDDCACFGTPAPCSGGACTTIADGTPTCTCS